MIKTILDFESRSVIDLRKLGVYVYASDPSTEILCCAVKTGAMKTVLWFPKLKGVPDVGVQLINDEQLKHIVQWDSDILGAHNAQFERIMWQEIMVKRHGFSAIPLRKWRCSAARAAALALPRHLDGVGAAINLPVQKDREGHKLMLRMCKPVKRKKTAGPGLKWVEDTPSLIRLGQYCVQDVEVEAALEEVLPPLPESEEQLWQLDQEINDRGVLIDIEGCLNLDAKVQKAKSDFADEIDILTAGKVQTASQGKKLMEWLETQNVEVDNMQKGTVATALKDVPEGAAKRILEIRQTAALASVAKLKSMTALASRDSRVRGSLLYHGATTGRWTAKGIQNQNLPRDSFKTEQEVEELLDGKFEGCVIKAASKAIRGMIISPEDKVLTAVDFSGVEARVLAWLAGETTVLDAFKNNLDLYKVAASSIYGVPYEKVTKDQRQVGKVADLACGYQGWINAFKKMAIAYSVDVGDDDNIKSIIIPWRRNRPATTDLWAGLEEGAVKTVLTGKAHRYGKIVFGIKGDFLYMKLPSGRMLAYPYPTVEKRMTAYGVEKDTVTFMGVNAYTHKWERQGTYGGKLTENAVQAISRDLLCYALLNFDMLGLFVPMHVHDEIVAETRSGMLAALEKIMSETPPWCKDLPLDAAGWEATRYRKE